MDYRIAVPDLNAKESALVCACPTQVAVHHLPQEGLPILQWVLVNKKVDLLLIPVDHVDRVDLHVVHAATPAALHHHADHVGHVQCHHLAAEVTARQTAAYLTVGIVAFLFHYPTFVITVPVLH